MKKLLFLIFVFFTLFIKFTEKIHAYETGGPGNCSWSVTDDFGNKDPGPFIKPGVWTNTQLTFEITGLTSNNLYEIDYLCRGGCASTIYRNPVAGKFTDSLSVSATRASGDIVLNFNESGSVVNPRCTLKISPSDWTEKPSPTPVNSANCSLTVSPANISNTSEVILNGTINKVIGLTNYSATCRSAIGTSQCSGSITGLDKPKSIPASAFSSNNNSFSVNLGRNFPDGKYTTNVSVGITQTSPFKFIHANCSISFQVPGGVITPYPTSSGPEPYPSLAPLCDQLPGEFQVDCRNCVVNQGKVWTAIGCIAPDFSSFVSNQLFGFGVGIAGGIAFLYFLYGAFLFLTSRGNPEQIAMGREIIMSSLLGLMLIVFSVFLLKIIAVDILDLTPFGFG